MNLPYNLFTSHVFSYFMSFFFISFLNIRNIKPNILIVSSQLKIVSPQSYLGGLAVELTSS